MYNALRISVMSAWDLSDMLSVESILEGVHIVTTRGVHGNCDQQQTNTSSCWSVTLRVSVGSASVGASRHGYRGRDRWCR